MKRMNRFAALVLAAVLLVSCLSGCSGNTNKIRNTLEII